MIYWLINPEYQKETTDKQKANIHAVFDQAFKDQLFKISKDVSLKIGDTANQNVFSFQTLEAAGEVHQDNKDECLLLLALIHVRNILQSTYGLHVLFLSDKEGGVVNLNNEYELLSFIEQNQFADDLRTRAEELKLLQKAIDLSRIEAESEAFFF